MRLACFGVLAFLIACGGGSAGSGDPGASQDVQSETSPDSGGSGDLSGGEDPGLTADGADLPALPDTAQADAQAPDDATVAPDSTAPDATTTHCPVDPLGANHDKDSAFVLTEDEDIEDLVVCKGVDDWFRLDVPTGWEMQFSACTKTGDAEVALEFFRDEFPSPDAYLGGGSSGSGEVCTNTSVWQAPGTYWFRVSTDQPQAAYRAALFLAAWWNEPCSNEGGYCDSTHKCKDGACSCAPDPLEPNDTADSATHLEFGTSYEDMVACVADDDWYVADLEAGDALDIHLETSAILGQGYFVNLAVFAADDTTEPVAFYPKATWSEDYEFQATNAGAYYLRVRAVGLDGRKYTLKVDKKS